MGQEIAVDGILLRSFFGHLQGFKAFLELQWGIWGSDHPAPFQCTLMNAFLFSFSPLTHLPSAHIQTRAPFYGKNENDLFIS